MVTGKERNDPAHFRQLVAQRNAAFDNFLQSIHPPQPREGCAVQAGARHAVADRF
jgi:hypothetical protein